MDRTRNTAFVIVVVVMLFSAIGYVLADVALPFVNKPAHSFLEGRDYTTLEKTIEKSPLTGEFQDKFEQYAADQVPFHEQLILLSAALQRQGIATMATVTGYPLYPTYYDSEHVVYPEYGYIFEMVQKHPKNNDDLNALINALNASAKSHPHVRFVVAQTLKGQHMAVNPTREYTTMKDVFDGAWIKANFLDKLDKTIPTYLDDCDTLEELRENWFTTDHHWTLKRAFKTYNWIADELDLEPAEWDSEKEILVSPSWEGTLARFGRDLELSSILVDQADDFSNLSFRKITKGRPGDPFVSGLRDEFLASGADGSCVIPTTAAYTYYYGDETPSYITNTGKNNGKTCLFVSDSYGYCLKRYIADNYSTTIALYPGNKKTKKSLDWYIEHHDVDDVIVLTNGSKYQNIADASPKFLGK